MKLDKGTIVRTILQVLVYINQVVAFFGQTSFAAAPEYQWATLILTIAITSITYWYNNDWTKFALISGDIFHMLKDGKVTNQEIAAFIEAHKHTGSEGKN